MGHSKKSIPSDVHSDFPNNIYFPKISIEQCKVVQARIEWVLLEIFTGVSLIDPPENSQNFVEKAHYSDATPLKISIKLIQSQPDFI